jgi:hypothetical protein
MRFPKVWHPFTAFVVVVIACRAARDFYPLNSFPMYADPGPEPSAYVVLRDGAGELVDIQKLTGETSAKVGKKYIDRRNDLATEAGIKEAATAPPDICLHAWRDVAGRLQRLAERRKKQLPDALQLQIGMIYQENDGFREEIKEIGTAQLKKGATQ